MTRQQTIVNTGHHYVFCQWSTNLYDDGQFSHGESNCNLQQLCFAAMLETISSIPAASRLLPTADPDGPDDLLGKISKKRLGRKQKRMHRLVSELIWKTTWTSVSTSHLPLPNHLLLLLASHNWCCQPAYSSSAATFACNPQDMETELKLDFYLEEAGCCLGRTTRSTTSSVLLELVLPSDTSMMHSCTLI